VDTSKLSDGTLVFTSFLMFVGASPGSTGGGIKTATFAMLLIAVVSTVRGRSNFEVFHRSVPRRMVHRALVVVTVAGAVVVTGTILLATLEKHTLDPVTAEPLMLRQVFFEVVSAFGTVGLSTGITRLLTSAGKVIIIITMLVGRIGPLTLVLALGQRHRGADYDYPEENLMIG
ncbi:MAG TPA: potassium transporter TrkG, partial [Planctomycetota bacterium]|nr:potassium transporter TrkG [Planctomycetota bacterium]